MKLHLHIISVAEQTLADGERVIWDEQGGSIGRKTQCSWVLPDTKCYLSGQHALVEYDQGQFFIRDTSANGVFVNRAEMPIGRDNRAALKEGDRLQMGEYEIAVSFQYDQDSAAPVATTDNFTDDVLADDWINPPSSSRHDDPFAQSATTNDKPLADEPALLPDDFNLVNENKPSDDPFFDFEGFTPNPETHKPAPQRASALAQSPVLNEAFQAPSIKPPDLAEQVGIPDDNDPFADLGENKANKTAPETVADSQAHLEIQTNTGLDTDRQYDKKDKQPQSVPPPQERETSAFTPNEPLAFDEDLFTQNAEAREKSLPIKPDPSGKQHRVQRSHGQAAISEHSLDRRAEAVYAAQQPQEQRPKPHVVSAKTNATQPSSDAQHANNQVLEAFLKGLSIKDKALLKKLQNPTQQAQHMETLGQLLHLALQGTLETLHDRARIKNEMRMDATTIRAKENNPLKFSISVDDALKRLFDSEQGAYMTPESAMQEAFDDLKAHQIATMAAVQVSLTHVLQRFNPQHLVTRLQKNRPISAVIPVYRQAELWKQFEGLYSTIENEAQNDFSQLFGLEFAKTYDQQVARLKTLKNQEN